MEVSAPPHVDLMPPPTFHSFGLPFSSYEYNQNIFFQETIDKDGLSKPVRTVARHKTAGFRIKADEYPAPAGPTRKPEFGDPMSAVVIAELSKAMAERPLWTRRSLINRLSTSAL